MPEMIQVNSSNLKSVGYDAFEKELYAVFRGSGRGYIYEGVSQELFDGLMAADSKGQFFMERIKPAFRCRRV